MDVRPQLRHMGLLVWEMEAMLKYYTEVLGLMVTDRGRVPRLDNREIVFLSSCPEDHHQLVLLAGREQGPSVVNQISFEVKTLDEMRAMNARLEAAAVSTIKPISHGNSWSLYSVDPDGNGIEVYADTPWHVAQPQTHALDLSMTDNEIMEATKASISSDPTFALHEVWAARMTASMVR